MFFVIFTALTFILIDYSQEKRKNTVFIFVFIFFGLITIFLDYSISIYANAMRNIDLKKQDKIEQQKLEKMKENHISKMCFRFDTNTKDFSKIYSLGYQNLLKIKEEIDNRRLYCFKNYCSDIYYEKEYNDIDFMLQHYKAFECKE